MTGSCGDRFCAAVSSPGGPACGRGRILRLRHAQTIRRGNFRPPRQARPLPRLRKAMWYKGFMYTADGERLADEIAELAAHLDAATHRFLTLVARFDEAGVWADQGARTCAHWLSWRVGLDLGAAREHVRVARALQTLPQIDDELRRGRVSYSKVRALTRVAKPETEGALLEMARTSTASQLERICRGYRVAIRNATELHAEEKDELRWVHERESTLGFVRFDIQVTAEEAAAIRRALEVARARAWGAKGVSAGTRHGSAHRADALVAVAEAYLNESTGTEAGPPVEVVVHVDADADTAVGGTLEDGTALPRSTTDRLLCDAAVVAVREDSCGNVLNVGRRRRTIPTLLRRALRIRDRGCRFPGCTNRLVDGHHVVPWCHGGATTLDNLSSLCRPHHTFVHDFGVRIVRDADGELRFVRKDGTPILVTWMPPVLAADPAVETHGRAVAPAASPSGATGACQTAFAARRMARESAFCLLRTSVSSGFSEPASTSRSSSASHRPRGSSGTSARPACRASLPWARRRSSGCRGARPPRRRCPPPWADSDCRQSCRR